MLDWKNFLKLFFLLNGFLFLSGCGEEGKTNNSNYNTTVLAINSETSDLELKSLTLVTLPDINKLSGQAADIYYMLSPKNLISSYKPVEIQTTKTSDNKYLPKSSLGLKLLSVYANYEKLFNFSKKLGVEKILSGP